MKLIIALALLLVLLQAEVLPFDNTAIEKIFQQKGAALFLFIGSQTEEASALEAFKTYDSTNPEIILSVSSKEDGHGLFDRLAEFLGVDTNATPQVLLFNEKAEKFRYTEEAITAELLASFVTKVSAGEIEQFLKSAPVPEPNDEPVKVVVGTTFSQYVTDSDKQVLVKFYAPWCGHCKTLAPHYDEAARLLANNPNILLVKIDSTENEVAGVDVQGFPTVKFWGKDKSTGPIDFNGQRTAQGIVQWLKEHTQYEWVEPVATEEAEPVEEVIDQTL